MFNSVKYFQSAVGVWQCASFREEFYHWEKMCVEAFILTPRKRLRPYILYDTDSA